MGVAIDNNDITIPGTATVGTAVIASLGANLIETGAPIDFSGLAWTPKTASAVAVNGVAFAFPLVVVRLTFADDAITDLDVSAQALTALDVASLTILETLDASGNALPEAEVDGVLAALDDTGINNGTVDLSGGTNAIPSAAGLASKASLEGKGWTVTVNS